MHNFKHKKIDTKKNYYRFRQFNPKRDKQYGTIDLTNGVKAIFIEHTS
jgi:hypothetical protein